MYRYVTENFSQKQPKKPAMIQLYVGAQGHRINKNESILREEEVLHLGSFFFKSNLGINQNFLTSHTSSIIKLITNKLTITLIIY